MSDDLLTLRLVVVSDARQHREIWREAANLASVPIEVVEIEIGTHPGLGRSSPDIVILDAELTDRSAAIAAARDLTPRPIVAVASASASKFDGADAVVEKPKNAEQARKHLERCVNMRLPKRVLVVDDSTTMRSIVRKILAASRYPIDVLEADDGAVALEVIGRGVDLVLLDYNMPSTNGFDVLSEIKRTTPAASVVMMTATENETLAAKAQASGARGFLRKPFYPADIDAVLDLIYDQANP